mmetsp:Transcript_12355/g.26829  ORF Transcript_12355/g.26829 Transcript_12355/m.26829 type:complete len:158 (+) Transcript_12355:94-567(+)
MMKSTVAALLCLFAPSTQGFAFVQSSARSSIVSNNINSTPQTKSKPSSSSLSMVDQQVLMGGGIALAGIVSGIGFLVFFEGMGERAEERGGGLSGDMATRITGGLMEDVEVDTVSDLSSLTDKLEAALKETGGADAAELAMSEEDKARIAEEAEDGW